MNVKPGQSGLQNLNNTCYLNALIQALSNIPLFKNIFLDNFFEIFSENFNCKTDFNNSISFQLFRIFKKLWHENKDILYFQPVTFKKCLDFNSKLFNDSNQNDPNELFYELMNLLHSEICFKIKDYQHDDNPLLQDFYNACKEHWIPSYSEIYKQLNGMYINQRLCTNCNYLSCSYNPELTLMLEIPLLKPENMDLNQYVDISSKIPNVSINTTVIQNMLDQIDIDTKINLLENDVNHVYDLQDCLKEFNKIQNIDNFTCSHCNTIDTTITTLKMVYCPPILVLHLKRFDNQNNKINNLITFPFKLDISNIMFDIPIINNTKYKLISVINHIGNSSEYGHYTTFALSEYDNKWYCYDDKDVSLVMPDEIITSNAYFLFYIQI